MKIILSFTVVMLCTLTSFAQKVKYPCVSGNCKNGVGRVVMADRDGIAVEGLFRDKYFDGSNSFTVPKVYDKEGRLIYEGGYYIEDWNFGMNGKGTSYHYTSDNKRFIYQEGNFEHNHLKEGSVFDENGTVIEKGKFNTKTGLLAEGIKRMEFRGQPAYLSLNGGDNEPFEGYRNGNFTGEISFTKTLGDSLLYIGWMKDGKLVKTTRIVDWEHQLIYFISRSARGFFGGEKFADKDGFPTGVIAASNKSIDIATNVVFDTAGINHYDYVPHILEAIVDANGAFRLVKNFYGNKTGPEIIALANNAPLFTGKIIGLQQTPTYVREEPKPKGDFLEGILAEIRTYLNGEAAATYERFKQRMANLTKKEYKQAEVQTEYERKTMVDKLNEYLRKYDNFLPEERKTEIRAHIININEVFKLPAKQALPD